jgi:hypothetical protein
MADQRRTHDQGEPDANRDPITGEPGAHPVGVGLGTAAGGAAAGAAAGAVGGPVGAVVGAVVGGVAGGLAGKGVAESIDPTTEDTYWQENYPSRPYYDAGMAYDDYRPAYQYGWESRSRHQGRTWDEVESDLGRDWDRTKSKSRLTWDQAKHATRDAWDARRAGAAGPTLDQRRPTEPRPRVGDRTGAWTGTPPSKPRSIRCAARAYDGTAWPVGRYDPPLGDPSDRKAPLTPIPSPQRPRAEPPGGPDPRARDLPPPRPLEGPCRPARWWSTRSTAASRVRARWAGLPCVSCA